MEENHKSLQRYLIYINDNINELKINHRKEVLQMIIGSEIDMDKIVEKGNGTQIRYADMSAELIQAIYRFIYNKLEYGLSNGNI